MSKFIVLDPSLDCVGGHHFDYDYHVVTAANELGYETVLATHRSFPRQDALPETCQVVTLFRYHTYNRYSDLAGIRSLQEDEAKVRRGRRGARSPLGKLRLWVSDWLDRRKRANPASGRRRRITQFGRDCARLFDQIGLADGDHVFVPTMSEIELLGLVEFLGGDQRARNIDWHLQFHFNIFDGRETEYGKQLDRLAKIRGHFQWALDQTAGRRLHFYTTSEPLARQYQQMEVADFEPLAYPVNPRFQIRKTGRRSDGPLRVTCAGVPRDEKGRPFLHQLVSDLSADASCSENIQLVVQGNSSKLESIADSSSDNPLAPSIVCVDHPLEPDQYVSLIRHADIGLLMYDSERYYARRAGVLGELLSAGVPVIVPAGCWLAEQIAEPIERHLEQIERERPAIDTRSLGEISFAGQDVLRRAFMKIPKGATQFLTSCCVQPPLDPGQYIRIQFDQFDRVGNLLCDSAAIVGPRESDQKLRSMIHLDPQASAVQLTWRNAYGNDPMHLVDVQATWLDSARAAKGKCPLGKVGLIAADRQQIPSLLRDMVNHYDHYRRTAEEFSKDWFARHDPRQTVSQLIAKQRQHSLHRAA